MTIWEAHEATNLCTLRLLAPDRNTSNLGDGTCNGNDQVFLIKRDFLIVDGDSGILKINLSAPLGAANIPKSPLINESLHSPFIL